MDNPIGKRCSDIDNCLSFKKMNKIKLYDRIVLASDLPDSSFKAGDVGTIVEIYGEGNAFEVEFFCFGWEYACGQDRAGCFGKTCFFQHDAAYSGVGSVEESASRKNWDTECQKFKAGAEEGRKLARDLMKNIRRVNQVS
jgi:hypothetical protein